MLFIIGFGFLKGSWAVWLRKSWSWLVVLCVVRSFVLEISIVYWVFGVKLVIYFF